MKGEDTNTRARAEKKRREGKKKKKKKNLINNGLDRTPGLLACKMTQPIAADSKRNNSISKENVWDLYCLFLYSEIILSRISTAVNWPKLEKSLAANRACATVASCSKLDRGSGNNVISRLDTCSGCCIEVVLDWRPCSRRWGFGI